ncbi:hypothetical protein TNCV_4056541 [Trichonephila clavipes]|nr:hypothetical protein TNCV_4056541 [Trichonephila clavipes]
MWEKVIENQTSRLDYIRASRGSHMPEIIFKIGYYKTILDQIPNEQVTAVRTDVESRNHVVEIPAQVEACMDSKGECFAWTVERGRSNISAAKRTLVLACTLDTLSSST